jgi:hypothetical protein
VAADLSGVRKAIYSLWRGNEIIRTSRDGRRGWHSLIEPARLVCGLGGVGRGVFVVGNWRVEYVYILSCVARNRTG